MTRNWINLTEMPRGSEATLGNALRAWIALNGGPTVHEAALYLQFHGVKGAKINIVDWMEDRPVGQVYTLCQKTLLKASGIDLDPIIVSEAKKAILAKQPELKGIVTFDRFETRPELIDELSKYVKAYGDVTPRVAEQIDVSSQNVGTWCAKEGRLPTGEYLEKVIIGMSRGLFPATCAEDFLLLVICREMFRMPIDSAFPGVTRFKDALDVLARELGDRRGAGDKFQVYGLSVEATDRMQNWAPRGKGTTMDTVLKVARSLVKLLRPTALAAFDDRTPEFLRTETVKKPIVLDVTPVTPAIRVIAVPAPEPVEQVPAPKPVPAEPAIKHAPPQADPRPVPPEPTTTPFSKPNESDGVAAETLRHNKAMAFHYRALADLLDPVETIKPVQADRTFSGAIGETIDGMTHCLGESGFPNFSGGDVSAVDAERIERISGLYRQMLLSLGSLPSKKRNQAMPALAGSLEETMMLAYGLLMYSNVSTVSDLIKATLDMARINRRTGTNKKDKELK